MGVAERRKSNVKGKGVLSTKKQKWGGKKQRETKEKEKILKADYRLNCTAVGGRSPDLQVKSPTLYQWY